MFHVLAYTLESQQVGRRHTHARDPQTRTYGYKRLLFDTYARLLALLVFSPLPLVVSGLFVVVAAVAACL